MDWLTRAVGGGSEPRMLETVPQQASGTVERLQEGLARAMDFARADLARHRPIWALPDGEPVPGDEGLVLAPRRIAVARALLGLLAERLGPAGSARMVLDLSGPGDAIGAEPCSEAVGGAPLPAADDEEIRDYVLHWWLRIEWEAPAPLQIRLGDVMLRRRRFLDPERDDYPSLRSHFGDVPEELLVHRPFRTLLRLRAGLGEEAGARWLASLRQAPPPEDLGPARLAAEQRGSEARLQVALSPGRPLEPAGAAALLGWMWPSAEPTGGATGAEEGAWHVEPGPDLPAWEQAEAPGQAGNAAPFRLPDEEELRRIELWAARERARINRRKTLEVVLTVLAVIGLLFLFSP